MSPIQQAGIAFALIVASGIAGAWLRSKLPEHHLTGDSKDVIKLSVALIATMSALVLALLFASTRTSFERTSGYVSRMTADIAELDKLLGEYGPEARPAGADKGHGDSILYMLRGLAPTDKVQTSIQARALQVSTDLGQTQLALAAQPADSISNTFIFVLVLWLMFIFAVFSMSSPPNPTPSLPAWPSKFAPPPSTSITTPASSSAPAFSATAPPPRFGGRNPDPARSVATPSTPTTIPPHATASVSSNATANCAISFTPPSPLSPPAPCNASTHAPHPTSHALSPASSPTPAAKTSSRRWNKLFPTTISPPPAKFSAATAT